MKSPFRRSAVGLQAGDAYPLNNAAYTNSTNEMKKYTEHDQWIDDIERARITQMSEWVSGV